jgi:methionine-S-sulfoxide reductase/methionine-R-sulfoxide reductase
MEFRRRKVLGAGGVAALAAGLYGLLAGRHGLSPTSANAAPAGYAFTRTDAEWRQLLTSEQYRVLRQAGTERAHSSPLDKEHRKGTFACAGCGQNLFASEAKFDSGTGWPSFYRPLDKAVGETRDTSFGMLRIAVHCSRCGGHLGHVFDDGPRPTGLRYCINGVAMHFRPVVAGVFNIEPPVIDEPALPSRQETAVFAGGCFWGVQAVFQHVKGVSQALSGYAGGSADTARYDDVTSGATGHAEAVRIVYDPAQVTYGRLLHIHFSVVHDPTQRNRQGPDIGTQYRSTVFAVSPRQREIALAYIAQLDASGAYPKPLATTVEDLTKFYPAERYHQDYLVRNPRNPYIVIHDLPKIRNLTQAFGERYRDEPVLVGK